MIQRTLKLKLSKNQELKLEEWLRYLTGIYNWAIRKIELNAKDKIYFNKMVFNNLLAGYSSKMNMPSHTIQGTLSVAYYAWQQCFNKISKKPRLKGKRNKLNSIPFPDPISIPKNNKIQIPFLGKIKFCKQDLPNGKIKCGRIIKRATGWHLCLFIDAEPNNIPITGIEIIGIDPGFKSLLTLSSGEKIEHPRELEKSAKRLAQAQRGGNKKLVARIHEKVKNQRTDRNHKLSRKLVSKNSFIAFSKDTHQKIAKKFGKSVQNAGHYQLQQMLSYKCRTDGRKYVEVSPINSTKTCSNCGKLSGPAGLSGLKVRQWICGCCGTSHDRDVNAARNVLNAAVGATVE